MLDAYQAADQLYAYVWTPSMFRSEEYEDRILSLIDRMIEDFHDIEQRASSREADPGFEIALLAQQSMLSDIRSRFVANEKDYANWRLRGLSRNCISCHSRFSAPREFLGAPPRVQRSSREARFAGAEFLLASRQFTRASDELFRLAQEFAQVPSGASDAFEVLKLWLVVQVRVENSPSAASSKLTSLLSSGAFTLEQEEAVQEWIEELKGLAQIDESAPLLASHELLDPIVGESSLHTQEQHLVSTLRATSILHRYLEQAKNTDARREATYRLAVAYSHLPIRSLEVFAPLYLEQCIREFPRTNEAEGAFLLYRERVHLMNSGSGGLHLSKEQEEKLSELEQLAFGGRGAGRS